jgi:predicted esterase YcpF (UPF0227 family)
MSDDKFTTVGELKKLLEKYDDAQPVFIGAEEGTYWTEFSIEAHTVWLGPVVVLMPSPDDEDDSES